ncbi:matrixin family metalloprotease [Streptomyces sp. NPDC004609]|uniref:matrixin family metalloprotease n=1 Tax=Streptomyces sp. NPDC004609 TaxID=3364704 RepID=UPI0036CE5426
MHGESRKEFFDISAVRTLQKGLSDPDFEQVEGFLQRFGYLGGEHSARGELSDQVSSALKRYQKQNALPVTGDFDEQTRDRMAEPRCGMPDPESGVAFSTACAWDRRDLTYAFDEGTSDIPGDDEFGAVRNAFQTWEFHTPLTFLEILPTDDPDILVGWRPTVEADFDMTGAAIAHADFPPACETLVPGLPQPLHFDNGEHFWSIGAVSNAHDVESVALHEIGHLIGLQHSSVSNAVMFPSIGTNTVHRTLATDDKDGALTLYPFP